jgi:hypothetical protein
MHARFSTAHNEAFHFHILLMLILFELCRSKVWQARNQLQAIFGSHPPTPGTCTYQITPPPWGRATPLAGSAQSGPALKSMGCTARLGPAHYLPARHFSALPAHSTGRPSALFAHLVHTITQRLAGSLSGHTTGRTAHRITLHADATSESSGPPGKEEA